MAKKKKNVAKNKKSEVNKPPVVAKPEITAEDQQQEQVRPSHFTEMIGQTRLKENFINLVTAAKISKRVFGHTLLEGLPGTGKTTLGKIVAKELGVNMFYVTGTSFQEESDIVPVLEKLKRGDILFVDEIHKLRPRLRVFLYQVMEDFHYSYTKYVKGEGDIFVDKDLPHFCLIGATTESGTLEQPLLDRFKNKDKTAPYTEREIFRIIKRSAGIWKMPIADDATTEIAKRSKFKPRIANNLLERVILYAVTQQAKEIDLKVAIEGCRLMGVDKIGLNSTDLDYLQYLIKMKGGPAGVDNIGKAIGEKKNTLEDHVEPYLIKIGFVIRTAKGRVLTENAYKYLNIKLDPIAQAKLATGMGNRYTVEAPKGSSNIKDLLKKK